MIDEHVAHFSQIARREAVDTLFEGGWITLYRCKGEEAYFSALIAPERVSRTLESMDWDLHWDNMRPHLVRYGQGEGAKICYERFEEDGVEPVVIVREGNGGSFVELAEDLRLFLDLYPHDDGALVQVSDSGTIDIVAMVAPEEVRILKRPLLRYLQARQMYLAVFFDHIVTLVDTKSNPLPEGERHVDMRKADRFWCFGSTDEHGDPISRLSGKRLLAPPPRSLRLESEEERYMTFIIGEDAMGGAVEYSANPAALGDFFGKNPDAPNYLTPVYFRRDVLDRYFHNPSRFEVSDGVVRCGSNWLLRVDDDHREYVIVFLGDLGRDLPYTEQLHWRAHNIRPGGALSKTARTRSFDARFADGEQPEHRFKAAYNRFTKGWVAAYGWPLFRPLVPGDIHLLTKLHVPTSNNPAELDAQLLGLAKILVDSLNDEALDAAMAAPSTEERSLAKLERYLTLKAYPHAARDVATLRAIQSLRSAGAAHTRGSNYEKALRRLKLEGCTAPAIITELLERTIQLFDSLADHFCHEA
jgi:hypothetical protein